MRWRSEVEGVLLLPLPVCLQSRFQQCQHVLASSGALLCCCLTEYAGCCVAAGCESQWGHLSETEEQTGSQTARQYSAGCSLPQPGVLWQLSGRVLLLCSWSSGHQLGWRGRRLFHLGDGCRHHCLHSWQRSLQSHLWRRGSRSSWDSDSVSSPVWVLSAVLEPVFPLLQGLEFQFWLLEGSFAVPRHSLWVPHIFLDLPPEDQHFLFAGPSTCAWNSFFSGGFWFHAEVSGGVDDWSVSSAFPLGRQLCTHVCTPKVEGLQPFPFFGLVCFSQHLRWFSGICSALCLACFCWFLRQYPRLWRHTRRLILQPLCRPVSGCRSWPPRWFLQVSSWWPVFWLPWLQLLQGVVSTSSVYRGLPQETLASQPVELAGCLILVRPSPLRWTVWRVCWPSWLCWAVVPSSQSSCISRWWYSGCGGQLWWYVLQRIILQSHLHAGCLTRLVTVLVMSFM